MLEEKLVKRGVSLKGLDYGKVEEATQNTVRQVATLKVGHLVDKAREINKLIKADGPKGVSSQTQGDTVRVTGKKRDDLQAVIALLKGNDLGIPLQFIQLPRTDRGAAGYSISCIRRRSSQRLNLRPTSRSMPTSSNPQLACSAREASPLASMRAIIEWKPDSRATSISARAAPCRCRGRRGRGAT